MFLLVNKGKKQKMRRENITTTVSACFILSIYLFYLPINFAVIRYDDDDDGDRIILLNQWRN